MKPFINSTRVRLTLTYVAIIMTMSILFSGSLYFLANQELMRQRNTPIPGAVPLLLVDEFDALREIRLNEARNSLQEQVLIFNMVTLAIGSIVSYLLALRTLRPVEYALDAQQRFTSDASHEIRTPLTAMRSEIEVALRERKLSDATAREVLKSNLEEIATLEALTKNLLQLASNEQQTLRKKTISLLPLVQAVAKKAAAKCKEKNINIEIKIPKRTNVLADKTALSQIFTILLDNAIKYSKPGDNIVISHEISADYNIIHVVDHGVGMSEDDLPHIFKRFYRADPARHNSANQGHGLGLAIAKQLVEQHDGQLDVSSQLGHGSTFTVQLPSKK